MRYFADCPIAFTDAKYDTITKEHDSVQIFEDIIEDLGLSDDLVVRKSYDTTKFGYINNTPIYAVMGLTELKLIVFFHELAHFIVGSSHGHDDVFFSKMEELIEEY